MREQVDATKVRFGRDEAVALARTVHTLLVAKGKNLVRVNMKQDPPDEDTLAAYLLGPSGNLRAPTLRHGKTLLVGFHEEAYREVLGA